MIRHTLIKLLSTVEMSSFGVKCFFMLIKCVTASTTAWMT